MAADKVVGARPEREACNRPPSNGPLSLYDSIADGLAATSEVLRVAMAASVASGGGQVETAASVGAVETEGVLWAGRCTPHRPAS